MDITPSTILKMATVEAYSIKKVNNLFNHAELPLITGSTLWEAIDKSELRPSGHASSALTTIALLSLKEQLKSVTKNNNKSVIHYHNRFSIQVDTILANDASPGEPEEIAILFIKNVNLGTVTDDLYKKVIKSDPKVVPTNFNLRPLAESALEELQLYNSMNTNSIYDMEGKETSAHLTPAPSPPRNGQPRLQAPAPTPDNSNRTPAPSPSPAQPPAPGRERAPLDFAAIDSLKAEIRAAPDITLKIVALFQSNVQCCPLHRSLPRPHALMNCFTFEKTCQICGWTAQYNAAKAQVQHLGNAPAPPQPVVIQPPVPTTIPAAPTPSLQVPPPPAASIPPVQAPIFNAQGQTVPGSPQSHTPPLNRYPPHPSQQAPTSNQYARLVQSIQDQQCATEGSFVALQERLFAMESSLTDGTKEDAIPFLNEASDNNTNPEISS